MIDTTVGDITPRPSCRPIKIYSSNAPSLPDPHPKQFPPSFSHQATVWRHGRLTFWSSPMRIDLLLPTDVPTKQCQSCQSPFHPESLQHIFLQCAADHTVVELQTTFLNDILPLIPLPCDHLFSNSEALHCLKQFILNMSSTSHTARFIHDTVVHWKSCILLPLLQKGTMTTPPVETDGHTT
ncbi:MAG: hypothetical protein NXY57DRAFT_1032299 [Lentinula lateritia]|nr:MAG: hypothetical protein NXY57DRAFT_1032299 [Lentinula lateritia]